MNNAKLLILLLVLTGCGPVAKFKNSAIYTEQVKPRNIYVIVVGNKTIKEFKKQGIL